MKKLLFILSLLTVFTIISQQGLAENAVFDPSSNTLTIPNVEFGNDTSLYNIKLQLQSDGSLSLLNIEPKSTQTNEDDDGSEFLYNVNPFLLNYKMYSESQGESVTELQNMQTISNSKKWDQEDVIGVYNNDFKEFTFYENGTGILTCPDEEMELDDICQKISAFEWTIDSYGTLVFGVFKHYFATDVYYRFIWALVDSNDDNSNTTVYAQTLQITDDILILDEGINTFTKQ